MSKLIESVLMFILLLAFTLYAVNWGVKSVAEVLEKHLVEAAEMR